MTQGGDKTKRGFGVWTLAPHHAVRNSKFFYFFAEAACSAGGAACSAACAVCSAGGAACSASLELCKFFNLQRSDLFWKRNDLQNLH